MKSQKDSQTTNNQHFFEIPDARSQMADEKLESDIGHQRSEIRDQSSDIRHLTSILTFLFFLLLPTQLGKHFFFPVSFIAGVRIDYLAPTLYVTDILFFLLFALNAKTVIQFFRKPNAVGTTLGLSLLLLPVIFSIVQPLAIYRYVKILEFISVFAIVSQQKQSLKLFVGATAIGAGFELILSLLQFVNKQSLQGIFYFFGERHMNLSFPDIAKASINGVEFLRPYGTFSHPNSLAGFYLLIYFFMLTREQESKRTREQFLRYGLLFITSCLIIISFSKVTIATFLILNILYLIRSKFYTRCKICFVARITTLVVLTTIVFFARGDTASVEKRMQLIKDSLVIIAYYPLFGVGLGNYLVAQHGFVMKYPYFFLQPVHNIFLLWLAETGVIVGGLILYKIIHFLKEQENKKAREQVLFCSLVLLLTGLFDHYWLTLQQNFLLVPVIFGLIYQMKLTSPKLN